MRNNSTKKNFIYNLIYQILILIIPLITAPYLSRVVGVSGVGTYSYTYSIVYYFMLLTLLGINNYGNRTIAKVRDNKEKRSKEFWSMYILQLFMGTIMLILYLGYVLIFDVEYKQIALIQSLFIFSSILDINWFFFGLEEFKTTITRNTFVKIATVILIFLIVKNKDDLWKYTLIMSSMTVLSQVILWYALKNKVGFVKIQKKDIIKHIKPNLILFIPVIAISLYKMLDKVMLGSMTNVIEVGYFENAEKIANIPMTIISALGTVMLPRMSNIIAKGEEDKVNNYITKSINFVMFLSMAMCFGLVAISSEFAPYYFGTEFKKTGALIALLSFTFPFLSFANVIRTQYLIPKEKDRDYIISVSLGAIVNILLNIFLIPMYKSIGACIGTIAAEATVMIYQTISVRKELNVLQYIKNSFPFVVKSILMFIIIYPISLTDMNVIIKLMIQVFMGCIIYGLLNLKYIMKIVNIRKMFNKIFKRKYI